MTWNQPGNDGQDRDPWGSSNKSGNSSGKKNNRKRKSFNLDNLLSDLSNKFRNQKCNSGGNNKQSSQISWRINILIIAVVIIVWFGSGFYIIMESDRGVILRFGEYNDVVGPGLHWKPTMIDHITPVNVETIREQATNGMILTSDGNIILVEMNVQYSITNPAEYLFNVKNPDNSLRQALDSAVRGVIGQLAMEQILTTNRTFIRDMTQKDLEETISLYKMGITILDVNFQSARPPEDVKAAFDDVISAREEKQKKIRQAHAYRNEVLPLAKGNAQKIIEEAKADKISIILKTKGEVESLSKILSEYRSSPTITRECLYINTMERIFSNTHKIIAHDKNQGILVLQLEKLIHTRHNNSEKQKELPSKIINSNTNNSSSYNAIEVQKKRGIRVNAIRVGRE
ncbi:Modulator of FtsH protease HflK [Candidatus Hartigia pinicola]|nr:Modulator of FtsH protease HflK [Candidatus Hartigia pinicola]